MLVLDKTCEFILKNIEELVVLQLVVYFDQQTGAPHAVRWPKSFFDAKTTFYVLFSHKMYYIN